MIENAYKTVTETVLLHLHSANMTIHELVLCKSLHSSNGPHFQQLNSLWTCLEAVKDWFEVFLSVSPILYIGFPMSVYAQLAHCLVTLSRLSTFEHPEWNLGLARQTCDMSIIADQVVKIFAQVKSIAGLDIGSFESNDMFTGVSRRIQTIKNWWDGKIFAESVVPDAAANATLTESSFDFSDDAWLRDMLTGGLGDYRQYMQEQ